MSQIAKPLKCTMLVLLLATPAAAGAAGVDPYANIRSVAIVSLLGDDLTMKEPGGMFDSGSPDVILDTGADLDGFVIARVRQAAAGRFTVVEGPIDPALLDNYSLPPAIQDRLRPRLAPTMAGALPDALIVVYPAQHEISLDQPYYTAHAYFRGLSLTHSSGGLLNRTSGTLSAQYEVSVIDTKTRQAIKTGYARLEPRTLLFGQRPLPFESCDEGFWPEVPDHPTQAELAQIRIDLTALIAASLPNALNGAGLVAHGTENALESWDGHPLLCK